MDFQIINITTLRAGYSDLKNATNREQTMNSMELRKTYSNTTTSSTEHGVMMGTESIGKTGIHFLAEGSIT
ncbi:ETX/MTX2 family pore-forming toxin [Bacillus cereus]|nr:ETX/MTX2 family pore-forming toxin [Bacillus cereus]